VNANRILTLALLLTALTTGWSLAADAKPGPSYAALTAAGYEVRAVNLIPVEDRQDLVADGKTSAVFVTLQRGPSTAICQFGAINWTNLVPASMEATNTCSVYPPAT